MLGATHAAQDNDKPWTNDLSPLPASAWNADRAKHLLERAGFGGTPQEVERLARMRPAQAVKSLVRYQHTPDKFSPFQDSGSHDAGLEPLPCRAQPPPIWPKPLANLWV